MFVNENGERRSPNAMDDGFGDQLARFGPEADYAPVALAQARAYCRRLAETHYENFSVATLLLPRRLRPHFHAIYAYCRWADDLGDETGGGATALGLLAWWRTELLRCYDGRPRHPVMVALAPTIRRCHIPAAPFLDLLVAFEQDQRVKVYATYEQLLDYCRHSANPVGRLVLYLCAAHNDENARLSDCICTGLQLANFWQDVARDADIGRTYLPAEDRARFGYTDEDLRGRRFTPAFAELMHFEVQRARSLFRAGWPLVMRLPGDVQIDIELFLRGGEAILGGIEALGYNVWQTRPEVSTWAKFGLLARAAAARLARAL